MVMQYLSFKQLVLVEWKLKSRDVKTDYFVVDNQGGVLPQEPCPIWLTSFGGLLRPILWFSCNLLDCKKKKKKLDPHIYIKLRVAWLAE